MSHSLQDQTRGPEICSRGGFSGSKVNEYVSTDYSRNAKRKNRGGVEQEKGTLILLGATHTDSVLPTKQARVYLQLPAIHSLLTQLESFLYYDTDIKRATEDESMTPQAF